MHVLGLPGNPVSAFVCAFLFMVPLLRTLAGQNDAVLEPESAVLGSDLAANDERADYLRATLSAGRDGLPVATPLPVQDSSMMRALATADCLVIREAFEPARQAGEPCRILKLPL
jgi:molybdopterin molybdotransferase